MSSTPPAAAAAGDPTPSSASPPAAGGSTGPSRARMDARQQIADSLTRGSRGLPGNVASGIAELASRMASDNILLQRLRYVVAADALGLGDTPSNSGALAAPPATSTPQSRAESTDAAAPRREEVATASTGSPSNWDLADRPTSDEAVDVPIDAERFRVDRRAARHGDDKSGASRRLPDPALVESAAAAGDESLTDGVTAVVDDRVVDELRAVFSEGVFISNDDSPDDDGSHSDPTPPPPAAAAAVGEGAPVAGGSSTGASTGLPTPTPATTTQQAPHATASHTTRRPQPAGQGGGHHHHQSAYHRQQSEGYHHHDVPSEDSSRAHTPLSGDGMFAFDAMTLLSSARMFHPDFDRRGRGRSHATDAAGEGSLSLPPDSVEPSPARPAPPPQQPLRQQSTASHRAGSELLSGEPKLADRAGAVVGQLWGAIYSSLFIPVGPDGDASAGSSAAPSDAPAVPAAAATPAGTSRLVGANEGGPSPLSSATTAAHNDRDASASPDPRRPPSPLDPHLHHHHTSNQHASGAAGTTAGAAGTQANSAVDERFLIAAAMLVNSALLWMLIQRGGMGGDGVAPSAPGGGSAGSSPGGTMTSRASFENIVDRVADVVQRAFSVASRSGS